jgi:iron complex outermembrane receptor protein
VDYDSTFEPEFVDAFELGSKNTLLQGALTLNTTAFYYDYKDYQVSQIRDRTAVNENFDATIWGLELETVFAPSRGLRLNANVGYLNTKIADGETSIDIMNRTQGNPEFIIVKPWVQLPSNCVLPIAVAKTVLTADPITIGVPFRLCGQVGGNIGLISPIPIDPNTGLKYDPDYYNGENGTVDINGGAGIKAQLGGNSLPNAPHFTVNAGGEYGRDILDGSWRVTLRGDAYWQSQSWARVYNLDPYDKLHGWYNANLSLWVENDNGLKIEIYAKNILDADPITDAFLNSDDSGLTTNVFVLDPRLVGFNVRKTF